ncbi:FecCD family ABC transporter permease [Streptomyces sp. 8L]|uniref:FecCD family ABC transporter permease n=1 Tax=Streptomyces sp. 8L TaxID=2877242 RepID=UPI001CD30775|nr:iron ABC transporter permease [Streptomyces sp. 8L]MCA1219795.1 iron ABC transporter permease [Streptomyces sp. 8L]
MGRAATEKRPGGERPGRELTGGKRSGGRARTARLYGTAVVFLAVAVLVGAAAGAADLNPLATAAALLDRLPFVHLPSTMSPLDRGVLFQIRLPRVVLGALVGGALSLAGAGYQGVFRNPLVDSSLLGSSAGAGLGATVAIVALGGAASPAVPAAAFAGSLAGVAFAYLAGVTGGPGTSTLLLAGLAVSLFLSAVQTYVLQRSSQDIQQVYSWLLGSLSAATWHQSAEILPYLALAVTVVLLHGRHLDVLSVGDEESRALGLRPGAIRLIVVAACALAAASAVAVSGLIGFVGIVVPHAVRRLAGTSYRLVLPLSLLFGAGSLVLADAAARTVVAPAELPIGVVTALIGSPAFVLILRTTRAVRT